MASKTLLTGAFDSCQCLDDETRMIVTAEIMIARAFAPLNISSLQGDEAACFGDLDQLSKNEARKGLNYATRPAFLDHLAAIVTNLNASVAEKVRSLDGVSSTLKRLNDELAILRKHEKKRDRIPSEIHYLRELFEFSIKSVSRAYGKAIPETLSRDITIKLVLNGSTSAEALYAETNFSGDMGPANRHANIELDFSRLNFRPDSAFAILLMIFHETFVHVVQDLGNSGQRKPFGDDCPLSEGFVDRAAYKTLIAEIESNKLPRAWSGASRIFLTKSEEVHADRLRKPLATTDAADKLARHARGLGKEVFDDLVRLRGPRGMSWTTALAMKLNVSDLEKGARRAAVQSIHRGLGGGRWDRVQLMRKLNRIVDGEDPRSALGL